MFFKKVLFTASLGFCFSLTGCGSTDAPVVEVEVEAEDTLVVEEVLAVEDEEAAALLDLSTITVSGNGTEPFWNFTASGSTLVFNEPSPSGPMATTIEPMTMTQNVAGTVVTIDGATIDIVATLGACNDGMSDLSYDYSAVMTRGADMWNGCANVLM